jgi:hypothetical protein
MAWEELQGEEIPDWISNAISNMPKGHAAGGMKSEKILHGNTFVYKVKINTLEKGKTIRVYRQLKSDYFPRSSEEATCPNCQKYVRKLEGDDVLTCHRCGWQFDPSPFSLASLFGRG